MGKIVIQQGDICRQEVGAIVNAANNELLHGGGLAAAIVKAGGQRIQEESKKIGPIPLGQATVTTGGKLKSKYVIHAASMKLGELTTAENLKQSIINSFKRAEELGINSIAFPAIGAGIGEFPVRECAEISLTAAKDFLDKHPKFEEIIFVLFSEENLKAFQEAYNKLNQGKV